MEPRPYSPDTAAFVASSLEAWDKFFTAGDSQSNVESVRQNLSTSEGSDSFADDSLDDALLSALPSKSDQNYEKLAAVMGSSYLELADLVGLLHLYIYTIPST